jgi:hypothetical protein
MPIEILFLTPDLQRLCEQPKLAVRKLGPDLARSSEGGWQISVRLPRFQPWRPAIRIDSKVIGWASSRSRWLVVPGWYSSRPMNPCLLSHGVVQSIGHA